MKPSYSWIGRVMRQLPTARLRGPKVSDSITSLGGADGGDEIRANTIDLGGDGGKFGGGGGGGVLGPDTEQVGRKIYADRLIVDGKPGEFPGGGGGGGGLVSPGAIAWDPAERNGTEGVGYSAGVDGQPGGDTTFSAPDVTILFSAPGGQAGLAGTGVRLTSDLFSLSTVMLCNYVEISNSLGYVVGAGWQSVRVLNIGDMRTFPIFMIIEAGGVPAGEYTIHADAWSPLGSRVGRTSFPITIEKAGDLIRIPRCVNLNARVDATGLWDIAISSDLEELARIRVMVKRFGEDN